MVRNLLLGLLLVPALALSQTNMEKRQRVKQHAQERFQKADTDGNGMLSKIEAENLPHVAKHFDEIDANKDGQITQKELRTYGRAHSKEARQHMKQKADEKFKKADIDGDGAISRVEAEQGMPEIAKHFDTIDTNKDSKVTKAELKTYAQQKRAARKSENKH